MAFTSIKDMPKAKMDKTQHANLFNNTVLPAMSYARKRKLPQKRKNRDWLWRRGSEKDQFCEYHCGNTFVER